MRNAMPHPFQIESVSLQPPAPPFQAGFSLVELLVVMAIIGILAGLIFPVQSNLRYRAMATRTQNTTRQVAQAWMAMFQENRAYPTTMIASLPEATADGNDTQFPMTPEAATNEQMRAYFELSDLQMKYGVLSDWGNRKARAAASAGSTVFDATPYFVRVKLDTSYDGNITYDTEIVKKTAIAWAPGETPERPVLRSW